MYMFPSTDVLFSVRSSKYIYGFVIDVVNDDNEILQTYYLHQKYNRVDDSPDSCWTLTRKDDHHYDEPLLTGRLVYGRTDPFSPLMKCLQFLNEKWGQRHMRSTCAVEFAGNHGRRKPA